MQTRSTRQRGNEQKVLVKRSSTRTAGAEHVYVVIDSETLKRNPLKVTSTNIGQTSQRPVKRRRTQSRTTTRTRTRSKTLPVSSDDDNSVKEEEEEEIKEIVKSDSEEEEEDDDDDDDDEDFKPENEAKITQLETSSEEEAEEEAEEEEEEEEASNSSNNRKRSNNSRNRRRYGDETPASPVNEETYRLRLKRQHERLVKVHPTLDTVWEDMDKLPLIEAVCETQPAELKLKLLPFQKEGLGWMLRQEISKFHGGILADEMGMGKTIQMISLMVSRPRGKPNLIIAPTVALMQWNNEINAHTSGLSVLLFHGINRLKDPKAISDYDIVLTTYSTVESTFRKHHYGFRRKGALVKEESPLHKIEWFRIILDEAHYIKDRSCNTARAVFALNSTRKWALSGTPMQNRVGELY
ncbi:SNF2 family N-terminal domain-containing protein [Syncephalis plumigaleata]|nr:SNF2 family N-terminal domain-containing protein [Syncephalis plumigaleata]